MGNGQIKSVARIGGGTMGTRIVCDCKILVPLPRFLLPTARPFFCRCKASIYGRIFDGDLSSLVYYIFFKEWLIQNEIIP